MGMEIERKFLIKGTAYMDAIKQAKGSQAYEIKQWYLSADPERTVRVRSSQRVTIDDDPGLSCSPVQSVITIKGKSKGMSRIEVEQDIVTSDAYILRNLAIGQVIEKTRYKCNFGDTFSNGSNQIWEIDVFQGNLKGLVLAEIELPDEKESINVVLPSWLGKEVTTDHEYSNSSLIDLTPVDVRVLLGELQRFGPRQRNSCTYCGK